MKHTLYAFSSMFVCSLSAFVEDTMAEIMVWILAMFMVVIVDLLMKLYALMKTGGEKIRWSKGLRQTLMKMTTYFAAVVMSVFVARASEIDILSKVCILIIMFGEGISILGNYCTAHNLILRKQSFINWVGSRFDVPPDIIEDAERKEREETRNGYTKRGGGLRRRAELHEDDRPDCGAL